MQIQTGIFNNLPQSEHEITVAGCSAQLCEKVGNNYDKKRKAEGKSRTKVAIKRYIQGTPTILAFLNLRRFDVCGVL